MSEKEYQQLTKTVSPPSPVGWDCLKAFSVGGLLCAMGEALLQGFVAWGLEEKDGRL